MTGDNAPYLVFYVLAIVLVASSFVGLRQPAGKTLKMVLAWVGIFAVVFGLFAFRSEIADVGQRLRSEATGTATVDGETVRIPIASDGHFWVEAEVNGRPVRFMVDSGASITTISSDIARAAGVQIGSDRAVVSTANGPAMVARGRAERLEIGPIERTDFPIHVIDQRGLNLLGMNFLSSLDSWRVEGNYLVLVR